MTVSRIEEDDSADEKSNHRHHPGLKDKDQQQDSEATEQPEGTQQSRGAEPETTKQSCDEKKQQNTTFKKIKMCTYYQRGNCLAGEGLCHFAHCEEEIGQLCRFGPDKKNQLCSYWCSRQPCPNKDNCQLAHGPQEYGDPKPPPRAWQKQKKARRGQQSSKEDQVQRRGRSPARRGPSPSARSDSRNGRSQSRKAKRQSGSFRVEPEEVARSQLQPRKTKRQDGESDGEELRQRRHRHDSRQRRHRHDSREKVLPIIIQTCSLFPLCSNLSAK